VTFGGYRPSTMPLERDAMPIFGIDVSRHQGLEVDWAKVRASGIDFMFARASLATTPDGTYRDNVRRARRAGVPVVGAYHFLYPRSAVSPVEQARLFVDRIQNADGILTMLDVELDRNPKTGETFVPTISDARSFATEFARLTGNHTLLMYAPAWYWNGHIGNPPASDLGPLCASLYVPVDVDDHDRPIRMSVARAFGKVTSGFWKARHGGWKKATVLQFSSWGKVAGYGGRLDLDAFNGTVPKLLALTGPAGQPQSALVPPAHATTTGGATIAASATSTTKRFHVVVAGETLSGIAARAGFMPTATLPAFRVMINRFPENARFRENPSLIHPGDRVRIA
jgi:GH25 family lysozyme M1 (1,4-beta-N-acetylmuramidase)